MSTKNTVVKFQKRAYNLSPRQASLFRAMRQANRYLTNAELRTITGITNPQNRMSELISMGIGVSKKWRDLYNDHGELVRVKMYRLEAA